MGYPRSSDTLPSRSPRWPFILPTRRDGRKGPHLAAYQVSVSSAVDQTLQTGFADPTFWEALYFPDLDRSEWYESLPSGEIEVALDDHHALRLEIAPVDVGLGVRISIRHDGGSATIGGNLDSCHGADLRWNELERLGRVVAMREPALPHPGPIAALLAPFAPLCVGDPARLARATLYEAFARLGDFDPRQIDRWHERHDGRGAGFRWVHEPGFGWTPDPDLPPFGRGMAMKSLRHPPDPDWSPPQPFPFESWNAVDASLSAQLEAARDAAPSSGLARALRSSRPLEQAWAVETCKGLPIGSEGEARCATAEPRVPVYRHVSIRMEKDESPRDLLLELLDDLLAVAVCDLDWGTHAASMDGDGDRAVMLRTAWSDWRIVELAREWGAWLGIRNGTAHVSRTDEAVPLEHQGHARFVRLTHFRCSWKRDGSTGPMAWHHQEHLGDAEREVLLRHAPTQGRHAEVELPDGGRLMVFGRTGEYEGRGVTIELERWTLDAARWLLTVMREGELTLLPQVITNTPAALERGRCPLPGATSLDDADALHRLIADGSSGWWSRRPPHLGGEWWLQQDRWSFEWPLD
ncbi:MAG TPA: hypothetical protein RMH99_32590 [Sandaracinaceae bacterium LLY-WYZ-13_1]|nr:hypothetical protein [Sandaracinaceae bacterium LLY-WYZ-13_1]